MWCVWSVVGIFLEKMASGYYQARCAAAALERGGCFFFFFITLKPRVE